MPKPTLTHPNNREHRTQWGHDGTNYQIFEVDSSGYLKVKSSFMDESGTPYGIKQIDGKMRTSSMSYLYDIA